MNDGEQAPVSHQRNLFAYAFMETEEERKQQLDNFADDALREDEA